MARRLQFRRMFWLALLLGLAFAGLGYRLVDLQVVRHEELKAKAELNTQKEYLLEPRRGDILDIKRNLLATVTNVKTVCADPSLIAGRQQDIARVLAPLLGESEPRLVEKLMPRLRQTTNGVTVTNQFVALKKKVSPEDWARIKQAMETLSFGVDESKLKRSEAEFYNRIRGSIYAIDEQLRVYPNQTLAAHVLGFAGTAVREVDETPRNEIEGKDGIEWSFNEKLAGVRGWRVTETDLKKRELVSLRDQNVEPRDGLNVVLTIDSVIQHMLESALAEGCEQYSPTSICGVVVRPRTGEILAMATLPAFDPNHPAQATRNRVVTDYIEPGSTFKIVVVSAALNEGVVSVTDSFDCENGSFHYGGRILHDHERYKILTVERIITKSSNIGAAKIGIKLGEDHLYDYIKRFGFGARTDIPLQGETPGLVYPPSRWNKVSIAQIPMGHGITVSPLQMTMAMCAIANKGVLMRPMLVNRLEDNEHKVVAQYAPQKIRQVMSERTAKSMVTALKTVVSPEGTAPKAALEHYEVAGKTGTAQKVINKVYVRRYIASFIGFFPAENPELCISIFLDDPRTGGHYGGQLAGPLFKQVAERAANYLNIKPDIEDAAPLEPIVRNAARK